MNSRVEQNIAALPGLLELLHADHAYLEQIIASMRQDGMLAPFSGDPGTGDGPWADILCLRRAWRLDEVASALHALAEMPYHGRVHAAAVWHEYVVPCSQWHPQSRVRWAASGVKRMAAIITPPLVPFAPMRLPTQEERILGMRAQGHSYAKIAQTVRCSKRDVALTLRASCPLRGDAGRCELTRFPKAWYGTRASMLE